MKRLKQMPIPIAVLIMVLLVVAGITFGNHNALASVKKEPESILESVSALASDRAKQAKNLLVVAKRNEVEARHITALEDAIGELEDAKKANQIASANQSLTFTATAVNDALQEAADQQDKKLATGVMDELESRNKLITREANKYNDSLDAVRTLYYSLPMRWLIGGMPEAYR